MPDQPDAIERRRRHEVAVHLQLIAGNPLDAEDVALFEMFEREGWSHERRLAYITEWAMTLGDKGRSA